MQHPFDKVGGRKFIVAVIAISAGVAIELVKPSGLSVELAGFLLGMVGAFSIGNVVSKTHAPKEDAAEQHIDTTWLDTQTPRLDSLEERISNIEQAGQELMNAQKQVANTLQQLIAAGVFKK
jgi:hypothetical protein